jgi:pimeloyl-ACP methyl ester carboxylesterase
VLRAFRLVALFSAVALVASGSASAALRPVSVASVTRAPIHAVSVPWGQIGYRSAGRGSPLVLIMGLAGNIDDWPPSLIAALAQHHHVIVFDNEGIGRTTLRPGALTITRMADDTATLIAALGLHRPDVMGWSMGGFIAQALAVRHPDAVGKLVLSATAPGTGKVVAPSAAVIRALSNGAQGALAYLPARPDEVRRRLHAGDHLLRALLPHPGAYRHAPAARIEQLARWPRRCGAPRGSVETADADRRR